MHRLVTRFGTNGRMRYLLGDVRDYARLSRAMEDVSVVLHCSALKHVYLGQLNPMETLKTNVVGTQNVIDCVLDEYDVDVMVYLSCHDDKTRAVTKTGIKSYDQVKRGDVVFTLNQETGLIEEKPIEEVMISWYKGPMIHFKGKRYNFMVTPDHQVLLCRQQKDDARLLYESAKKSSQRSVFRLPRGKWKGVDTPIFKLPEVKSILRHPAINCPFNVKTEDLFYLMGVYIGDGFPNDKGGKEQNYGGLFLDIPKTNRARVDVESTLRSMGISYHCYSGKAGEHIFFSSRALKEVFLECGRGAENKHIPPWVLDYSPRYLKCLHKGLLDSDGDGERVYSTNSILLVRDLIELGVKLGLHVSCGIKSKPKKEPRIKGRKINTKESYWISFTKTDACVNRSGRLRSAGAITVDYEGIVWCLRVKDNHNFLVERKGRIVFSGNSDKAVNPSNFYGQSKAMGEGLTLNAEKMKGDRETRFTVFRPGNFFLSAGNVVEKWLDQRRNGDPITLTRGDMRRYYIGVGKAAELTYKVSQICEGGDVWIPKMMEYRMEDLAHLIGGEIEMIDPTPGEKEKEELWSEHESKYLVDRGDLYQIVLKTSHPRSL